MSCPDCMGATRMTHRAGRCFHVARRWIVGRSRLTTPFALLTLLVAATLFAPTAAVYGETPADRGDMPTPMAPPSDPNAAVGSLVIMGGCERFGNAELWDRLVKLAGGEGSRIAVFPTASGNPIVDGNDMVRVLNDAGADAFLVPLAVRGAELDYKEVAKNPQYVDEVRQATGVFFVGGSQARIRQALFNGDDTPTPMLDAIHSVYQQGGVIAGTSAGAAIMSRVMYRSAPSVLATLTNGVNMGKELEQGLGFLHPDWFVDQHCLVRGRFARALVAMQSQGFRYGVGIDEDTALVVTGDEAEVIGYRGVVLLDLSQATRDPDVATFNMKNARLSYLDRGDTFNLRTLDIDPSPEKAVGRRVDPSAAEFRPRFRHRLFCNDILGNMAVHDMMVKLLDNQHAEAIGLAFDGAAASQGPTGGFEFRFYRDSDTSGWNTEAFGGDDYTVLNMHLDITPIKIPGPFYSK